MSFDTSQSSYIALRNVIAERTQGIVFWVGSGLSAEAGLPTWSGLKEQLLKSLQEKIDKSDGSADCVEVKNLKKLASLISNEENNWRAFEHLKDSLGETTWRARIREILTPSSSVSPPTIYEKIWKLQPHGLLTLNLDRLASLAYTSVRPGHQITEFIGRDIASYTHVLKNPNPFLCRLHGNVEDASSWILTQSALKHRLKDEAYINFIQSSLSTRTVVFVGISADDLAVGGFLEHLSKLSIDVGEHYWITNRRDSATSRWAEKSGIRLTTYSLEGDAHAELLEAFEDLLSYVSVDDTSELNPIAPDALDGPSRSLPAKAELLRLDAEEIREILNQEATRILASDSVDATKEYKHFAKEFDQAIYRAWYTSDEPDYNLLLGHTLHERITRGAFGTVYDATDSDGNRIAVKVLHEEMRRNDELFDAFRRGVRSMKILKKRDVQGMVPYRKAFEIPAFVVMDWIDGPDLTAAVSAGQVSEWDLILRIGSDIANIVRRGHQLPERVLHRDLRPSNVMLRGFYTDPQNWDVVVLDFDLSWHRGAFEKSVTYGSTLWGYLAPEQITDIPGVSTRHASVDSFGLGMLLFFMLSGEDPVPDQHKHADWAETLLQEARKHRCREWVSIPRRFARLIHTATLDSQSQRWDMAQIEAELGRLRQTVLDPMSTRSAELVAEEIAARCPFTRGYEWNADSLAAMKDQPSGLSLEIRGDETLRRIVASMSSGDPGVQGKKFGKRTRPSLDNARDILESYGWEIEEAYFKYTHLVLSASLPVEGVLMNLEDTVNNLDRAFGELRF